MNEERFIHTYENHWAFAPENLIATINHSDDIVEHPYEQENIKYYLKKIPWSNSFFKAVVEKIWWFENTTFFERISNLESTYQDELEKTNKKSVENPINTYRKRSRGKVQPASSSEDSITKNNKNANKNWEKTEKYQIADESLFRKASDLRISQMERRIIEEYWTTDNPSRVAFIDNKWNWINGNMWWYGNYRDVDHREIAQTAFYDFYTGKFLDYDKPLKTIIDMFYSLLS